ncbi:unnamed protein product [Prorocentrum cordatum]|uniref:Uncharacterized protein n=1 Tax=Prorocentrum cordatum TaxID=2364126 RepID=A0ABN9Q2J0_9DINO|nr:unnamed protein product [Polarella glacialis]|mmetsp:Transcript_66964/g.174252  ORF Transcript_66964/g.174252 Transcript_66964/m.174252 type:complete len:201 (+) Transcript_66964:101-703(+)
MGCSSSSSPKTFRQSDAWHPDARTAKGGPCGPLGPLGVAPKNSMGSCGSTISTSAGAVPSLRSSQNASVTSSIRSLKTLSTGSRDVRRLPPHLEAQRASAMGHQARPQGADSHDDRSTFRSASQSRKVPVLGPVEDSTMMERRRSKSKDSKRDSKETASPATPSTSARGEDIDTTGGCKPDAFPVAEAPPANARAVAGDF